MLRNRILAVAMAFVALSLTITLPADATPSRLSCYGNSCYGLSPAATGCAQDAVVVYSAGVANLYVELRFSTACGAAWARIHGHPSDYGFVKNSQGRQIPTEIITGFDAFSYMVNDEYGVSAYACVIEEDRTRFCTNPY